MKIKDLYIPFVVQKNFLMSIWKDSKKALILRVMLIILNGLNSVVCAYCPKMFVDQIVITGKFFNGFIYILLMILFLTINRIVSLVESNVMGVAIEKAKIVQKTVFLQNMNNIEGPFFDSASNKNKLKIAKQYNENGGVNILDIITQILTNFISLIGMLLVLPFISIWVYLLLVGVSVFRFIGNAKISKNQYFTQEF